MVRASTTLPQHDAAARRQPLEEAQQDELARLAGEGAADRRGDIDRDARQDDRAPAEAIARRAVEDLAEAERQHEGREGELNVACRAVQLADDGRQRRQVHVDRQRREGRQQGQQDQQERREGGTGCVGGHRRKGPTHITTRRRVLPLLMTKFGGHRALGVNSHHERLDEGHPPLFSRYFNGDRVPRGGGPPCFSVILTVTG
jgi:hypothetical protein